MRAKRGGGVPYRRSSLSPISLSSPSRGAYLTTWFLPICLSAPVLPALPLLSHLQADKTWGKAERELVFLPWIQKHPMRCGEPAARTHQLEGWRAEQHPAGWAVVPCNKPPPPFLNHLPTGTITGTNPGLFPGLLPGV